MTYTGVSSLVHYLLCHVTAYAFRRKFGPLSFSPKNTPNFMITQIILFENAVLVLITWFGHKFGPFEGNYSDNHTFRRPFWERRSVDQTCDGMHMPSHDRGGSGPNLRPPCNLRGLFSSFVLRMVILNFVVSTRSQLSQNFEVKNPHSSDDFQMAFSYLKMWGLHLFNIETLDIFMNRK